MFYIVTDCTGTYARCFEGGPRLDRIAGKLIQVEVLGVTDNREAAQAAAKDLHTRLDRQRRDRRHRYPRLVAPSLNE